MCNFEKKKTITDCFIFGINIFGKVDQHDFDILSTTDLNKYTIAEF